MNDSYSTHQNTIPTCFNNYNTSPAFFIRIINGFVPLISLEFLPDAVILLKQYL